MILWIMYLIFRSQYFWYFCRSKIEMGLALPRHLYNFATKQLLKNTKNWGRKIWRRFNQKRCNERSWWFRTNTFFGTRKYYCPKTEKGVNRNLVLALEVECFDSSPGSMGQSQVRVFIFISWYKAGPAKTHALEGPHLDALLPHPSNRWRWILNKL